MMCSLKDIRSTDSQRKQPNYNDNKPREEANGTKKFPRFSKHLTKNTYVTYYLFRIKKNKMVSSTTIRKNWMWYNSLLTSNYWKSLWYSSTIDWITESQGNNFRKTDKKKGREKRIRKRIKTPDNKNIKS